MSENQLYVTESRVAKLKESLSVILTNPEKVTAKGLAQVAGSIVSMSQAIGRSVYLHSRHVLCNRKQNILGINYSLLPKSDRRTKFLGHKCYCAEWQEIV